MDIEQHDTNQPAARIESKNFKNLTLGSKIDVALVSLSDVLGLNTVIVIYRKSSAKLSNMYYYGL